MQLPGPVASSLEGFGTTWEDRKTGSEAQVFRFVRSSAEGRYLKISSSRKDASLEQEAERMRWLADKLPVPRVICYHQEGAVEHLITTELPGASSHKAEALPKANRPPRPLTPPNPTDTAHTRCPDLLPLSAP